MMPWFCAHILESIRVREGVQESIPVYENIYLVEAKDSDEAWLKAEKIGVASAIDDPSLTLGRRPARQHFEGIRKIVSVQHEAGDLPASGDELTYSVFEVAQSEDISKLVEGEAVTVSVTD